MMVCKHARFHRRRILSLCDNMAAVLALDKGRAGDPSLNRSCKRATARCISCEMTWRRRHIPTDKNMTDWGSRAADRGELPPGCRRHGHLEWLREVEVASASLPVLAPDVGRSVASRVSEVQLGEIGDANVEVGVDEVSCAPERADVDPLKLPAWPSVALGSLPPREERRAEAPKPARPMARSGPARTCGPSAPEREPRGGREGPERLFCDLFPHSNALRDAVRQKGPAVALRVAATCSTMCIAALPLVASRCSILASLRYGRGP